jgi:DNA polymerase III subunit delta
VKAADRKAIDAALTHFDPATRLVLLYGPDEAQAREIADRFTALLAPAADPMGRIDFEPTALSGDPAKLADEAAAVSMFGDRRLIRVDGAGDNCTAAVEALLTAPAAGNPVVMVGTGSLKATSALIKVAVASPLAVVAQCFVPDGREAVDMVIDACVRHGLKPSREAAEALAAGFGGERGVLARELEKLALYLDAAPDRVRALEMETLAELGAAMAESDFDALVNAVADGNSAEAEAQAAKLGRNGIVGIPQLRAVARRLMLLGELRRTIDSGRSAKEAVEAARPPIFWKARDRIAREASAWNMAALRQGLSRLLEAERQIKSPGAASPELLTSRALLAVAHLARRRR